MNKLVNFYDTLLGSLGCIIDEDTREVFLSYDGEDVPVYVNKKRLVAVNNTIVRNGLEKNQIAFHPLSESATAGMSEVHQWILQAINLRLNTYMSMAAVRIADIASNPELQSKLKPKEISLFKNLTDVDPKLVNSVATVVDQMDVTDKSKVFSHIRCKRSGSLGGKTYGRVTYVTFPIIDELESGLTDGTVFGKNVRKKDIRAMISIFKDIILNNKTDIQDFSSGNTTTTAPYLSSILTAFYNILTRLNSLQRAVGTLLKTSGLPCDTSWYPDIGNFVELQKAIPQLDGNVGTVGGVQEKSRQVVTKQYSDPIDEEVADVSGIGTAIEESKEEPEQNHGGLFRAVPIKGGMGAKVEPLYPQVANPMGVSVPGPVDVNSMTMEQYIAYKNRMGIGGGYQQQQMGYGQAPTYRGRDAYEQRKKMEAMGMNYNAGYSPYPTVGGHPQQQMQMQQQLMQQQMQQQLMQQQMQQQMGYGQMPQQQVQPQLVNMNGQLVQVVPVDNQMQMQGQMQMQPQQPMVQTGMFEKFSR